MEGVVLLWQLNFQMLCCCIWTVPRRSDKEYIEHFENKLKRKLYAFKRQQMPMYCIHYMVHN